MRTVHLPWESVAGPKYRARELKPRKKWVTVGGWVLSVLLILGGLVTPYWMATVFGALYVLTLLAQKDVVVTTRGLEIFYQMHITTQYDCWTWEQMDGVAREDKKLPELVALYFSKGDRVKRLYFLREDAEKIMALARERNPGMIVAEADESQKTGSSQKRKRKKA